MNLDESLSAFVCLGYLAAYQVALVEQFIPRHCPISFNLIFISLHLNPMLKTFFNFFGEVAEPTFFPEFVLFQPFMVCLPILLLLLHFNHLFLNYSIYFLIIKFFTLKGLRYLFGGFLHSIFSLTLLFLKQFYPIL